MMLITIVAFDFSLASRQEVEVARNYIDHAKVSVGAKSALTSMIDYILYNFNDPELLRVEKNGAKYFFERLKDCNVVIKVVNENSKLNINSVQASNMLDIFKNIGIEDAKGLELVDCINDWIDRDNLHRFGGAEDDYYQSLDIPYEAKDAPMTTVFELLLVKGITPEMFFGKGEEAFDINKISQSVDNPPLYRVVSVNMDESAGNESSKSMGLIDFIRISDKIRINAIGEEGLKELKLQLKDKEKEKFLLEKASIRSYRDIVRLIGESNYRAIRDRIEILNNNVFNITVHASSGDGSVRERIHAKALFDMGAEEKFKILEYKEGV